MSGSSVPRQQPCPAGREALPAGGSAWSGSLADADQQADRQQRAALLTPLFYKACALLLRGVEDLGDAGVRRALARMAADPEERIGCELAGGVSAWDAYQSGGALEAQFAELLVGRDVSCPPDGIAPMLRALSDAGRCRVEATDDPWRFTLRVAELPEVSAILFPSPPPGRLEELAVLVCIGSMQALADGTVASAGLIRTAWEEVTDATLAAWWSANRGRALADHPGFAQVVERPSMGAPGVYLVRVPRFPFSPLMPAWPYQRAVAWTVFETAAEFRECERHYQALDASATSGLPSLRPPCAARAARLAGGLAEACHRLVATPWPDVGAVSVLTLPAALVRRLPAERRAALHRGRYAVHTARTPEEANGVVRELYGPGLDAKPILAGRPLHPKAAATVVVGSPKLVVVSDPGIEDEAQALFITGKSLAKTPVPAGAAAVAVIGENPDLTEALLPHVRLAAAPRAGDAGDALAEALASEARVVVLDREALGFAVLALPERVERGRHRVTVAVMSPSSGEAASVVELARKLDAPVLLFGTLPADGSAPLPEAALLAGLLNQAGIECHPVAAIPAPPVPLASIAQEIWGVR